MPKSEIEMRLALPLAADDADTVGSDQHPSDPATPQQRTPHIPPPNQSVRAKASISASLAAAR